jgi:hypothetical protein
MTAQGEVETLCERAKELGINFESISANEKDLAALDYSDGPWLAREVRTKIDALEHALADVREHAAAVTNAEDEHLLAFGAVDEAETRLRMAKRKANQELKRSIKWIVIIGTVVLLYRACT